VRWVPEALEFSIENDGRSDGSGKRAEKRTYEASGALAASSCSTDRSVHM
jgi:hypothetical protein